MPVRWIICPVITEPHPDGGVARRPAVADLEDLGKKRADVIGDDGQPTGETRPRGFQWSAVIMDGEPRCLAFVRYIDPTTLDAMMGSSGWMNVLGQDYEDQDQLLAKTPQELGWATNRVNQARNRIGAFTSRDASSLTRTTPLWEWIAFLGNVIRPGFTPSGTYAPECPVALRK